MLSSSEARLIHYDLAGHYSLNALSAETKDRPGRFDAAVDLRRL